MSTTKVKVQCNECGKKFATASLSPLCPKCGGADVDVRELAAGREPATPTGYGANAERYAKLAQLGARVVEILRSGKEVHVAGDWLSQALRECASAGVPAKLNAAEAEGVAERIEAFDAINGAARSLGLLGEKGGQP